MGRYALRRVLLLIPTVFGVTLLAFAMAHLAPGDAAVERFRRIEGRQPNTEELAAQRRELGLDKPAVEQYLTWVSNAAHGDLGRSFTGGRPVGAELAHRLPVTFTLTGVAIVLALLLAVPTGVLAAVHQNRLTDHLLRVTSLAGASLPSFWLGLILINLFAVRLGWLPVAGRQGAASYVLPAVTLAVGPAAVLARFTRAAVLETLSEDYVRTARAKGLGGARVVTWHALRATLVPLVTAFGNIVGHLLAGAVIIETIFAWQGIGQLSVNAITGRDYPVIQGVVLYAGLTFAVVNLIVDLSYTVFDPRIRLARPSRARAAAAASA